MPELTPSVIPPTAESPRQVALEDLFVRFVAQGVGRRYGILAKETGVPVTELIRHAQQFLWRERIAAIHIEANDRVREEMVETIADTNKRHITNLRKLQTQAMEFLERHTITKTQDAIKLILAATKLEREAHGLDKNSEQARLQDILEAKLDRLLEKVPTVSADVLAIRSEFPDPVDFDAGSFPEPGGEDGQEDTDSEHEPDSL